MNNQLYGYNTFIEEKYNYFIQNNYMNYKSVQLDNKTSSYNAINN
jgi:hypothetical protein